ncbi:MAG: signal peptidase I [Flavobacteriales bacterium]|nr:signal peptidase I [Flavobacteriales bacterium]
MMTRRSRMIIYSGAFIAAAVILLLAAFAYGRITGDVQFYHVPTPGSAPSVPRGAYIIASKWIDPEPFDLICYNHEIRGVTEVWVQRICGLPGDTIELREGALHVNGIDADSGLRLQHRYGINQRQEKQFLKRGIVAAADVQPLSSIDLVAHLPDDVARDELLLRVPYPWQWEHPSPFYRPDWSEDEVPSIVVPDDHWFMLGDNRHSSVDSRYIGFVHRKSFVGTVIKVFR